MGMSFRHASGVSRKVVCSRCVSHVNELIGIESHSLPPPTSNLCSQYQPQLAFRLGRSGIGQGVAAGCLAEIGPPFIVSVLAVGASLSPGDVIGSVDQTVLVVFALQASDLLECDILA